ncbi:branched-chain amino acid ABC transporter permease [Oecophyllibacter saccharovorans]|uniref:AzlC family ABC transporter permease n=1 Tax=Oecophyllibacter saccharovorans TaxID=2558360 RepID=UPI0011432590|nr:AzlC family ABC transporter permease [Oecophyllibacter saccharovorans]QDH15424.1 branched-chain amino acid ABC transporter permease [Oecophyllibacter saccharovorans]
MVPSSSTPTNPSRPDRALQRGMKDALPLLLGTVPYALVLGAQARSKGLALFEVPLLTGLNFAGASDFAAIQVWTEPPAMLVIVGMTFLINSRHLLMGAVLSPFLRGRKLSHILPALFILTDESWALSMAESQRRAASNAQVLFSFRYYSGVAGTFYVGCVAATTLGAVIGPILGPLDHYGLDMAFSAVFLVLLRSMWTGWRAARPWLTSLVVAAATFLLLPGAWYVVAGTTAGLLHASLQARLSPDVPTISEGGSEEGQASETVQQKNQGDGEDETPDPTHAQPQRQAPPEPG